MAVMTPASHMFELPPREPVSLQDGAVFLPTVQYRHNALAFQGSTDLGTALTCQLWGT